MDGKLDPIEEEVLRRIRTIPIDIRGGSSFFDPCYRKAQEVRNELFLVTLGYSVDSFLGICEEKEFERRFEDKIILGLLGSDLRDLSSLAQEFFVLKN